MTVRAPLLALLLFTACRAVEIPEESLYRLEPPAPAGGERLAGGVLRIGSFALAGSLSGDALMVGRSRVALQPFQYHRWVAPLDRMVADAVTVGFVRSRCFDLVKSEEDPGTEDLVLHGRVLDFHQEVTAEEWLGVVRMMVWLEDREGRCVFQREVHQWARAPERDPEGGVVALSQAVAAVVDEIIAHMKEADVFRKLQPDAGPAKD